ncbi:MAG: glutamate-5-semialdehyde dehydrogenase [Gammaproteobacteria bacterium]|nr:glutamate-5-semialdehyde dehydrogenase [Gammaproteobacteria bacterium]|tara:strand:- start:92 stop:1354 length:1263 start_codon:yes stop_codon:yes gene_type:complete
MSDLKLLGKNARLASKVISNLSAEKTNLLIKNIAKELINQSSQIIDKNKLDIEAAQSKGMSAAMIDRLVLNEERITQISNDALSVSKLDDVVGEIIDHKVMDNGLDVSRIRVPLGVIGVIYESRPNVTIDIACLCIKSGNAVILRGGSESINSNLILTQIIQKVLSDMSLSTEIVQLVQSTDRSLINEMLRLDEYIDLMIPRGGQELVNMVAKNASMPSITGGVGVCHTYIDESANWNDAVEIVNNAKVQRPYVCNAMDTVLIHSKIASDLLPEIANRLSQSNVEFRCDSRSFDILKNVKNAKTTLASDQDWDTEFLDLIAGVKVVDSLDMALDHIDAHGTGHSEAIITNNSDSISRFRNEVDASAVMINSSTRFNDGGQLGLGAEVAISTNKLHARGPMGLRELMSYKWIVQGDGQIRK